MDIIQIAKRYIDGGFSPIPLRRDSKIPALKGWQKHIDAPIDDLSVFGQTNGIGLVMGYDDIQCLDIDAKHFEGDEYNEFVGLLETNDPALMDKMVIQRTISGGYHWIFKCSDITGNEKLAKNKDGEVTFETRGRGGQIVVWPTKGYKIDGKITDIQRITPDERKILFTCARMMNAEMPKAEPMKNQPTDSVWPGDSDETTPWGEFRATYNVLDILTNAGWTIVDENERMVNVRRPGNTTARTSGAVFKDSGLFFPFTTSTAFDAEQPYDAFQAFVVLAHGGDFQNAIRELRNDGFGKSPEPQGLSDDALFDYDSASDTDIDEMLALLQSLEVDSTIVVDEPDRALSLRFGTDDFILGTLGNFSLIQGKAKSRKSYFLSALMAAAIAPHDVCGHIRGHVHDKVNIYIDTEQGDWHASRAKHRIQSMAGLDARVNHDNFKHYRFRGLTTNKERLRLTDYIMQSFENIGYVVIDGMVDLASKGVNDEEEATALASKLLEWTSAKNCHISVVLHENKGDNNAKGHLGAYLVQKAETTISLAKSENTPGASEVTPEYTRNMEFPPMTMTITGYDTIELQANEPEEGPMMRVLTADDYKRLIPSIVDKTPADAVKFIRDIESVPKRMAEKVVHEMEANGMIQIIKRGRASVITTTDFI